MKFVGESESHAAYKQHVISRDAPPQTQADQWWLKTKFDGESEFRSQFTEKPLERRPETGKSQPISVHRVMVNLEPAIGMVRDSQDSNSSLIR